METPESVLAFWFGPSADDAEIVKQRGTLWWSKDTALDRQVRERFEPALEAAAAGRLNAWAATPEGRLALIVLTDQCPRNAYRGSARAFAYDALALGWCLEGLAQGEDERLRPIQRVFFYMPLEHAEVPAHQDEAVRRFEALVRAVDPPQRSLFAGYLGYAIRHREVVARFGRFPHRNAILGRASTHEEAAFLTQPGSSF